jgi:hypothetical protein
MYEYVCVRMYACMYVCNTFSDNNKDCDVK